MRSRSIKHLENKTIIIEVIDDQWVTLLLFVILPRIFCVTMLGNGIKSTEYNIVIL